MYLEPRVILQRLSPNSLEIVRCGTPSASIFMRCHLKAMSRHSESVQISLKNRRISLGDSISDRANATSIRLSSTLALFAFFIFSPNSTTAMIFKEKRRFVKPIHPKKQEIRIACLSQSGSYGFLLRGLAKHAEENTGRDGRADHARDIRSHRMHEEVVGRIILQPDLVRYTSRHRDSRDAC